MGPYTRFFWLISSLDFVLSSVIYESKLLPQSLVRLELNQNKLRLEKNFLKHSCPFRTGMQI